METKQIQSIIVQKLFGLYDYTLSVPVNDDNVFILYGDNGTGKSTLLRLVYHLLSSEDGAGHRTYIANVKFRLFKVVFVDGTEILVERDETNKNLLGDYVLSYNELKCKVPCVWQDDKYNVNNYALSTLPKTNMIVYNRILSKIGLLKVFYISDKRNDNSINKGIDYRYSFSNEKEQDQIQKEMALLHDWIIGQALEANKKGEEGSSQIYVKILSNLSIKNPKKEKAITIDDVSKEIEKLSIRAKSYSQIGFISETNYDDVLSKLRSVLEANQKPAANILIPYIEMQKNKLDALDDLFETIQYLIKSLNEYFYKKKVFYSVSRGFKILQDDNHIDTKMNTAINSNGIDFDMLSSGERQLLSIFSMVIRESNQCPIIVIDEPEISLNIKWQRKLLSTLKYFARNTKSQFVVATHSFEILASHMNNTVKLGESFIPE